MAQTVSDADLQAKRERVEKLRQQVEDAERTRTAREREQANAIVFTELEAEEARLEAQLASAKDAAKVTSVKEGASGPLQAARTDLKQAQQAGAAAVVTPTTGEGS